MKKMTLDLLLTLALIAICVFFYGEDLLSVLKEVAWFYGVIIVVGVLLMVYIGWALTRAMNPKIKKESNECNK